MKRIFYKFPFHSFFAEIVATSTFRQSSVTFTGTVINAILGAVFYLLAARLLGPAVFGLLSVVIVTQTLITDIGDLGINTGLVNFIPRYIKKDLDKTRKFLKLALETKIIIFLVVLILGLVLSGLVAKNIFDKPELQKPLQIGIIGVGALSLFSFITQVLQAKQKYFFWSSIQIATNACRVLAIFLLTVFGYLSLESTLWVYITLPFIGFVIGLFLISPDFLKVKNEWAVAREFFNFNKWVAAFAIIAAISSRLDTFISARLLSPNDLGLYSAANQLVRVIPMIISAIGTVIAPKMASLDSKEKLVTYLKKTQVMVLGIAVLGVIFIPFVLWIIPIVLGPEYIGSGSIFIILLFAMLIFLISVPIHTAIIYYFSYPKLFFRLAILHLVVIAVSGWILTSSYGALGTATSVLIGQIVNFLIPLCWVLLKVKKD